jgi:DNA polymerase III epsilon subunit family exonuclease
MILVVLILSIIVLWFYFRSRRTRVDLSHLPEIFVVLDLETSGLSPHKNHIIEIGAIRAHRDTTRHETFQVFVRPPIQITKEITAKTGITNKVLEAEEVDESVALRDFLDFVGSHRLVAFHAKFDMGFLHAATRRHGMTISNPVSCALKMARRAWPGRRSYRLIDLAKDGNLSTQGAHRALKDCELALIVYTATANRLRSID